MTTCRDVLEAVRMSVNPKVIETPNISAVAKDGIELLVKARVTVRTILTSWLVVQVRLP